MKEVYGEPDYTLKAELEPGRFVATHTFCFGDKFFNVGAEGDSLTGFATGFFEPLQEGKVTECY